MKHHLSWLVVVIVSVSLHADILGSGVMQDARSGPDEFAFSRPIRRPHDARPVLPPELPPAADFVKPLTFDVVVRRQGQKGPAHTVRQTVSRARDRIHMALGDREWLFQRNPVDPRRVSGQIIDHAKRAIVLHEESDLRNMLGLNGWADVLLLGLDMKALNRLQPTTQTRLLAGIRFVKHAAPVPDAAMPDVWWSPEQALPSAFTLDAGAAHVSIERLRPGVDSNLLRAPSDRFPAHRVFDLAEWLEGR